VDAETGEVLWLQHYPGEPNNNESVYGIACDPDGNAFITGRLHTEFRADEVLVAKLDQADGSIMWMKLLGGLYDDAAWTIVTGPDRNPMVGGLSSNGDGTAQFLTAKLASTDGTTIWSRFVPGASDNIVEKAAWIAAMDNGDAVMVSRAWNAGSAYDVVIQRYAASDGATIYDRTFASPGGGSDIPRAMIRSPEGNILIAGGRNSDFMTLDLDGNTGLPVWTSYWNGPIAGWDMGEAIAIGASGDVIVTGLCTSNPTTWDWDAATIGLDRATGALRWSRIYDGGDALSEEGTALATGPEGDIYVVGYGYMPLSDQDILGLRYQQDISSDVPTLAYGELSSGASALSIAPNPFRDRTAFMAIGSTRRCAGFEIFDASGRRIRKVGATGQVTTWDGTGDNGEPVAPGIYLVRPSGAGSEAIRKIIRLR
jgi:hypothetical protein